MYSVIEHLSNKYVCKCCTYICVCVVSKRFQSLTGQESLGFCLPTSNANSSSSSTTTTSHPQSSSPSVTVADLDALKREILSEVHREIAQAKQEIIEGVYVPVCLSRCDTN